MPPGVTRAQILTGPKALRESMGNEYMRLVLFDEDDNPFNLTGGETGPEGPMGPAGPRGDTGLKGDKGDKGDTGSPGAKGDTGAQGPTGTKGDKGDPGNTGPPGEQGDPGTPGEQGPEGPAGQSASIFEFMFSTALTEPPTGSEVRLNHASASSATKLWVRHSTVDSVDISNLMALTQVGDRLTVQDKDEPGKIQRFNVTSITPKSSYMEFGVTFVSGGSPLTAQRVMLLLGRAGTPGRGVPSGGTTAQVLRKKTNSDYDTEWATSEGGSTDLSELQDTVSTVQTELGNLKSLVESPAGGDLEGTYPNLTVPYMAQIQIQITNLEGLIQALDGRVAALESA